MSIRVLTVLCVAGITVAGSIAVALDVERRPSGCPGSPPPSGPQTAHVHHAGTSAADGGAGRGHPRHLVVGPTCNRLEMVAPQSSTYRPDIRAASPSDRARARWLVREVMAFCRSHSAEEVTAGWLPGAGEQDPPTHFFNPDRRGSLGLDPSNPRAALLYDGEIGGVMFTGTPLPPLGSIPRPHTHDPTRPREMLHVYCSRNPAEALTPSRRLGVLADSIALRQRIREDLVDLQDPRLTLARRRVRAYLGRELPAVEPLTIGTAPGVDPLLRAKRDQVRRSLLLLTEPELRTVLSMIRRPELRGEP